MHISGIPHLVLCTGNPNKVAELRALLGPSMIVHSLADQGLPSDLPETGDTLEANALQKARYAFERCGLPCLADDTGLEVHALGGRPGVRSARYASEAKDPAANMDLLLAQMRERTDRSARFRTVIALVSTTGEHTFVGVVEGMLTHAPRGTGGFGYDPIFVPLGHDRTFAEMAAETKNLMSHRARAMQAARAQLLELERR